MAAASNPDFDVTLTRPGGSKVQCDPIINIPNSKHGGIKSFRADISQYAPGNWKVELQNNAQEDYAVVAFIYGDAGTIDNAYFNDAGLNAAPMGIFNKAVHGESAVVQTMLSRGEAAYTGITQELAVCKPNGEIYSVRLNDDGDGGDMIPGDGIYAGVIDVDLTGLYVLKNLASNENGTATIVGAIPSGAPAIKDFFEVKSEAELMVVDDTQLSVSNAAAGQETGGSGCNAGTFAVFIICVPLLTPAVKKAGDPQ